MLLVLLPDQMAHDMSTVWTVGGIHVQAVTVPDDGPLPHPASRKAAGTTARAARAPRITGDSARRSGRRSRLRLTTTMSCCCSRGSPRGCAAASQGAGGGNRGHVRRQPRGRPPGRAGGCVRHVQPLEVGRLLVLLELPGPERPGAVAHDGLVAVRVLSLIHI